MNEATMRQEKQPLFDTLIVPEAGTLRKVCLFTDFKRFPDGSEKVHGKHHNFMLEGFLGTPFSYRLNALELHIEKFTHPDDVVRVLKGLSLKFVISQDTVVLNATGTTLRPYLTGSKEDSQKQLEDFAKRGMWLHYRQEIEPMIIESTMSFRVDAEAEVGELRGSLWAKVMMQDTLIRPI